jgi:hypothetical protein
LDRRWQTPSDHSAIGLVVAQGRCYLDSTRQPERVKMV